MLIFFVMCAAAAEKKLTNCLTSSGAYLTSTHTHTLTHKHTDESVLACGWLTGLMCVSGARVSKKKKKQSESGKRRRVA